ncbi:MAG: transglutaminase domain-containing protein [Planctomycetes bacterium]|nr:transglutaminase domain-containing protein [Planctomycetota bacterium]
MKFLANDQPAALCCRLSLVVALCLAYLPSAGAQIKQAENESPIRYGATQITRYQVGMTARARGSSAHNILAIVAVPISCAEQEVELVEEDVTPQVVSIEYRLLNKGARQMLVSIPRLERGEKAHALLTFEVRTRVILPPEETSKFRIPVKPKKDLKVYMGRSPYIETNHSKLKKVSKKIFADLEEPATDWERVEAIYDFVRDSVEYLVGDDKSALETLRDGEGDCQNISALFVGLCRTNKIPARIVWVHEHSYAEFCLEDEEGNAYWFPIESSGSLAFGEMPLARTILQKGDNFKLPEQPRKRRRYASDFATAQAPPGGAKPSIKFVRIQL